MRTLFLLAIFLQASSAAHGDPQDVGPSSAPPASEGNAHADVEGSTTVKFQDQEYALAFVSSYDRSRDGVRISDDQDVARGGDVVPARRAYAITCRMTLP